MAPQGKAVGLVNNGRGLQTAGVQAVVEYKFGSQVWGRSNLREKHPRDEHLSEGHLLGRFVVISWGAACLWESNFKRLSSRSAGAYLCVVNLVRGGIK